MTNPTFYRPAEASDFENAKKWFAQLPLDVQDQIKQTDNIRKAQQLLWLRNNFSHTKAQMVCENYRAYLQAEKDFHAGKPVYVNY